MQASQAFQQAGESVVSVSPVTIPRLTHHDRAEGPKAVPIVTGSATSADSSLVAVTSKASHTPDRKTEAEASKKEVELLLRSRTAD